MVCVSIIVCTRNRAQSLAMTLESLERAIRGVPEMVVEVVLVDNGSSDETQGVIKQWAESVPFSVLAPYETRRGLSFARNTGIRTSSGSILVFTDDDCTLSPDYLVMLEQHYKNDELPVMRGGMVELGTQDDMPFSIKLNTDTHHMTATDHPGGFIIGANMTMHRDVVKQIGLFDERFGAGAPFVAGEDTDYVYRCYTHGIMVEYVPDVVVKHFHGRRDMSSIGRLNHGYHVGNGALYAKYLWDRQLLRHFYWDCKTAMRCLWRGDNVRDGALGITWTGTVAANIHGMALYWSYALLPWKGRRNAE